MSVAQILADYEASKLRKEQDEQAQRENASAEAKREGERRAGNAREVELHLVNVIRPILLETQTQIRASGYVCDVETALLHDPHFSPGAPTYALRLRLSTKADKRMASQLEYRGLFSDLAIVMSAQIECAGGVPIVDVEEIDSEARPLRYFNSVQVGVHVREFVEAVFKPVI